MAQLHYQPSPLCRLCFSLFPNPYFSCLSSLSSCVSSILQCSARVSPCVYLINRSCWAYKDQSSFLDCPVSSPHPYFSTCSLYTCTVLLFVFTCISVVKSLNRPCKEVKKCNTRRTTAWRHIFFSLKLLKPPVNMNVTCILCIYATEIQHTHFYTLLPTCTEMLTDALNQGNVKSVLMLSERL